MFLTHLKSIFYLGVYEMKKLLKTIPILAGMVLFAILFMACPNNSTSQNIIDEEDKGLGDILIERVTFDGKLCAKEAKIDTNKDAGVVSIEFKEAYANLNVKINNENVTLSGKIASKNISNIKEEGTEVKIEATAEGKKNFLYKFVIKKLKQNEIGIENVSFEGKLCPENATTEVDKDEGIVKITFVDNYEGLQATLNGNTAVPIGKVATAKVSNITFEGIEVKINISATGKEARNYNFKLKRVVIKQLTFTGKDINPSDPYYKVAKDYYYDKAPYIKDIKSDGSTKVGDAREGRIKITVKYTGTPSNPKLEVKNLTTNDTVTSNIASPLLSLIDANIDLEKGDNNLVITYRENDDLPPHVIKAIVGYKEPKYEPISRIVIHGNWYATQKAFENLEKGSESIIVAGQASTKVEVEMPATWYYDTSEYTIKLDGTSYPKTDFEQTAWGENAAWTLKKDVALKVGETKELKIEFENPSRSYKKEYKVNIVHYAVNELDNLIFVDGKTKKKIASKVHNSFKFNVEKSYYMSKTNFSAEDRAEKAHLFASPREEVSKVKYAFSTNLTEPNSISSWQEAHEKNVSYIDDSETITKKAYAIENQELNYGIQYLYLLLEKDTVKTFYITEVFRDKVKASDVTGKQELVYQDDSNTKLPDEYPLATKGLIRVLPKNPKATVALVTPEEKQFEKKDDGWFECLLDLPENKTRFSYKIIGEDTTKTRLYQDSYYQAFHKAPLIREIKFDYKQSEDEHQRVSVGNNEGTYYLSFNKNEVKDNKIYLYVKTYKNLGITTVSDFKQSKKTHGETSTSYIFALDVTSLMDNSISKKDYSLPITLNGSSCNPLKMVVFLHDEIIKGMYVRGHQCVQLPGENKWVCKADMNISGYKRLVIDLYLLQNETAGNTNRSIKVFQGSEEKVVSIDENARNELSFIYNNLEVKDKEKISLTIKYFADKTQTTTPTKEYSLEIEDL